MLCFVAKMRREPQAPEKEDSTDSEGHEADEPRQSGRVSTVSRPADMPVIPGTRRASPLASSFPALVPYLDFQKVRTQ